MIDINEEAYLWLSYDFFKKQKGKRERVYGEQPQTWIFTECSTAAACR